MDSSPKIKEQTEEDLAKDRATMEAIGKIYCRGNHDENTRDGDIMCPECRAAIEYTLLRASVCPYGHAHNCDDCKTPCQRGENKENIKRIMRYAAPRMILRHPLMTLDRLRKRLKSKRQLQHKGTE